MRNDRNRECAVAQRSSLSPSKSLKRGRTNRQRDLAPLRHFYTVVDTPRRARPSVTGPGNHHITFSGKSLNYRRISRKRRRRFAAFDHPGNTVAGLQQFSEVIHQMLEIRFRVVDETHGCASQCTQRWPGRGRRCVTAARCRRIKQCKGLCHDVLKKTVFRAQGSSLMLACFTSWVHIWISLPMKST